MMSQRPGTLLVFLGVCVSACAPAEVTPDELCDSLSDRRGDEIVLRFPARPTALTPFSTTIVRCISDCCGGGEYVPAIECAGGTVGIAPRRAPLPFSDWGALNPLVCHGRQPDYSIECYPDPAECFEELRSARGTFHAYGDVYGPGGTFVTDWVLHVDQVNVE